MSLAGSLTFVNKPRQNNIDGDEDAFCLVSTGSSLFKSLKNVRGSSAPVAGSAGVSYILLLSISFASVPWDAGYSTNVFATEVLAGMLPKLSCVTSLLNAYGAKGLFDRVYRSAEEVIERAAALGCPIAGFALKPDHVRLSRLWTVPIWYTQIMVADFASAGVSVLSAILLGLVYAGCQWNVGCITPANSTLRQCVTFLEEKFQKANGYSAGVVIPSATYIRDFPSFWCALFPDRARRVHLVRLDRAYLGLINDYVHGTDSIKVDLALWRRYIRHLLHPFPSLVELCKHESVSPTVFDALLNIERSVGIKDVANVAFPVRLSAIESAVGTTYAGIIATLTTGLAGAPGARVDLTALVGALGVELAKDLTMGTGEVAPGYFECSTTLTSQQRRSLLYSLPWQAVEADLGPLLARSPPDMMGVLAKMACSNSHLALHLMWNVKGCASLSPKTSQLAGTLHPRPPLVQGAGIASDSTAHKTYLAKYAARVVLVDSTGALPSNPLLVEAAAPSWFLAALLSASFSSDDFNMVDLLTHLGAVGDNKDVGTIRRLPFEAYMFDLISLQRAREKGHLLTVAFGFSAVSGVGLTYAALLDKLIEAIMGLRGIHDARLQGARVASIRAAFADAMVAAAANLSTQLSQVPTTEPGDFGPFVPDANAIFARMREEDRVMAPQLLLMNLQTGGDSAHDPLWLLKLGATFAPGYYSQGGASTSGAPALVKADGGLSHAVVGSKSHWVKWSSSNKSFWYGNSTDYFKLAEVTAALPGLCPTFAMSAKTPGQAVALCCSAHLPDHGKPGEGAHVLPPNIATLRASLRHVWKGDGKSKESGSDGVKPDSVVDGAPDGSGAAASTDASPGSGAPADPKPRRGRGKGAKGRGRAGRPHFGGR